LQASPGAVVELDRVTVCFGEGAKQTVALESTSLKLYQSDLAVFVGPSGCGKSTILRLAAGLQRPTTGHVLVGGRDVEAKTLRVGMAFQNASLMPWLTVEQNVMLPLRIVRPFRASFRRDKAQYRERVHALLRQVGLSEFATHYPWQLSGGMLQRANLCRALVHEPQLLLLDEPFGALDQFTKEDLWEVLQTLWLSRQPTVLLVTHDLREATFLATRICVMSPRPGRVVDNQTVAIPHPRTLAVTYEPEFLAIERQLRRLITPGRVAAGGAA
jgi:NitT/TauT family transport system ATP-binding protein